MSRTRFAPEALNAVLDAHAACEFARDLDGTLATVGPEPLWEFHPLGLRVTGLDAIREMYALEFQHVFPYVESATDRVRVYGDDSIVCEQVVRLNIDGDQHESHLVAVLIFDAQYVTSERVYASGALADLLAQALGGDFRSRKDVHDLTSRR